MKVKNRLFKSAAVVLSVLLLISSLSAAVSAAGRTPIGYIVTAPHNAESEYVEDDPEYLVYKDITENYSDAVTAIYDGVLNGEERIDIRSYGVPVSYWNALWDVMKYSFPELCYVSNYTIWRSSTILTAVEPQYISGDIEEMKRQFRESADDRYLSLIDDSMDDFTKAVILHDALVLNTYYPDDPNNNRGSNYSYMVEDYGVCQYYSECYAYLLAQCGIKSEVVTSDSMNHEWLKINLDGKYYNIDNTWDDITPDRVGRARHSYFLYSDEVFKTADDVRNRAHTGYLSINRADSTDYDSFDNLRNIMTQLCYIDGVFYAINSSGQLVTYDHTTDSINVIKELGYRWSAGGYSYWIGNFSSLAVYDGKLYYNSPNAVYQYDPATGETELFAEGTEDYLYGLRIINGQLWGVYAATPNDGYITPTYMRDMPVPEHQITVSDSIAHGTVAADKLAAVAGETVTLTVKPDEEFVVKQVTVNDAEIIPTDGVYQFVMPPEDAYVSAEFDFADGMGAISGYTLSLKGDIGVNFYMELADDVAGSDSAYMLFTVPNGDSAYEKSVKVSDAEKVTDENSVYYVFECGVFAKDMVSDIKARIVDGDTYGTEYSYSVEKYAKYILDHPEVDEYASAANMVKAMLNYGSYSQVFFNNNVTNLANASLEENDKVIDDVTAALINKSAFSEDLPADVTFEGASLSLQSETTLSLYFKSDAILDFDCPNRVFETAVSGQYQVIRIRNISAKEIGDDFTVSVSADDTQGTISYSPMNYCYNVLSNEAYADNTNLQNVVRSIYKYWQSAKYYFNYNI